MKNFKKILFSFILICTFFCFSKNIRALPSQRDVINSFSESNKKTCTYRLEYPFKIDNNENTKYAYSLYIDYISKKVFGNDKDVFSLYEQQYATKNSFGTLTTGVVSELSFKLIYAYLNNNSQYSLYTISGMQNNEETLDFEGYNSFDFDMNKCPDLVAFSFNSSSDLFGNHYNGAIYPYFIDLSTNANNIDNISIEAFKNEFVLSSTRQDFTLLFMSDEYKRIAGGIAYVNYAYNPSFTGILPEKNIDPIVEKYLKIPNFKSSLDELNKGIDSISNKNNIGNDTINNQSAIINELVASITNLDEIPSDLKILKNFNSVKIGNTVGLRNILNSFLEGTGEKAGSWFEKYMQDSKAKYVDALIMVLEMIENNDDIKNLVNFSDKINESYKDYNYCLKDKHTAENCIEECKAYYTLRAEYECSEKSSGSNYNACISSYPNPSVLCKNKSASDIQSEIASTQNDVEESIKDSISKKIVELYENQGIDIGNNDLCSILLGDGKDDGLYFYIRLVLNLIRIAGPILVVLLTAFDGMKVITSFKGDENKKFWNHLKIRLICLVILILVPTIINYIVNLFIDSCPINV